MGNGSYGDIGKLPPEERVGVDRSGELVERAIGAIGDLDIEAVSALLADDFVLELPFRADGGPRCMESDQAVAFMRALPTLLARMNFHDVVVHGAVPTGEIVAEYRSDGVTHSGRPYQNRYVSFITVRDGRIARWREFFDPTVVKSAFGHPQRPV